MLIPAIDDTSHWYNVADYPLEAVIDPSNEVKKVMTKRAGEQSKMALDRILSRIRSRTTKGEK